MNKLFGTIKNFSVLLVNFSFGLGSTMVWLYVLEMLTDFEFGIESTIMCVSAIYMGGVVKYLGCAAKCLWWAATNSVMCSHISVMCSHISGMCSHISGLCSHIYDGYNENNAYLSPTYFSWVLAELGNTMLIEATTFCPQPSWAVQVCSEIEYGDKYIEKQNFLATSPLTISSQSHVPNLSPSWPETQL